MYVWIGLTLIFLYIIITNIHLIKENWSHDIANPKEETSSCKEAIEIMLSFPSTIILF
jgi:hypothetical protein